MSAQRNATAWFDPIGRPNVWRCVGVGHRVVDAALDHADGERGDGDASVVEDLEELCEAAAALAEQVVLGHPALDERQAVRVGGVPAHLAVRRLHLEAGRARRHDDGGDLTRTGERGDGDERRDRRAGVGDERLLAVDHPLSARRIQRGPRACAAGVGAGVGLGQPEAPRARPAQRSGSHRSCWRGLPNL